MEHAFGPGDGPPVVARRGARDAQGRGDHLQRGELGVHTADHLPEGIRRQRGVVLVDAIDGEAEGDGEVFFVAEQHVGPGHEIVVDFPRPFRTAEALP